MWGSCCLAVEPSYTQTHDWGSLPDAALRLRMAQPAGLPLCKRSVALCVLTRHQETWIAQRDPCAAGDGSSRADGYLCESFSACSPRDVGESEGPSSISAC